MPPDQAHKALQVHKGLLVVLKVPQVLKVHKVSQEQAPKALQEQAHKAQPVLKDPLVVLKELQDRKEPPDLKVWPVLRAQQAHKVSRAQVLKAPLVHRVCKEFKASLEHRV